jgi:hypothetical protein
MSPILSITSDPKMFVAFIFSLSFIFSLIASIVLFKFLKSSAVINNKSYQAGGALAGFVIVFTTSYFVINNWMKTISVTEQKQPVEKVCTMIGNIKLEGRQVNDGIRVSIQPSSPMTTTDPNGDFRINEIPVSSGYKKENNPAVKFECPGYLPRTVFLYDTSMVKLDSIKNTFTLNTPISLISIIQ